MEAPHLKKLQSTYGDRGLRVIAINAWDEPTRMVSDFLTKNQLDNYTVLMNGRSVFKNLFKGQSIPHNFLIDGQGKIVYSQIGFDESDLPNLEQKIETLLTP